MQRKYQVSRADRDFFQRVSRAAFANPFGDERAELDRQLSGDGTGTPEENLRKVIREVTRRVDGLQSSGGATLGAFDGDERATMRTVFLFDVFHRHLDHMDELILQQSQAGDAPCAVPFAGDALGRLASRGFEAPEALRYLALFYQLRRAYFFIEKGLIGRSRATRELRKRLWQNVFTQDPSAYAQYLWDRMEDFSTLLLGATGSGKGAAAAAIGRSGFIPFDGVSGRFAESFTRNFIALNLSQYPESLIESELFGHRKGSFTGAIENHQGVFSRCTAHGAILLDEIGDASIPVQIKLLQVLQERTFSPVGSHERLRFRGRVIAATNRPLDEYRRTGRFRDDLFYRLCSDIVVVPSLRSRIAEEPRELDLLIGHLAERTLGRAVPGLTEHIRLALARGLPADYPWPGNVRELEQAVRRVILTGAVQGEDRIAADRPDSPAGLCAGDTVTARGLLEAYCRSLYGRLGTYGAVARRAGLDRRTVKRYIAGDG